MQPKLALRAVVVVLCMAGGACWASDSGDPSTERSDVKAAVWILPPAYEFSVSQRGHVSLEVGATSALWPQGAGSHDTLGPRFGGYVYPTGNMEGLALYAGVGAAGTELGLWGVWRGRPKDRLSGGSPAVSFRIGIGAVISGSDLPPFGNDPVKAELGLGAAIGRSF
jgi:hypothetical protein